MCTRGALLLTLACPVCRLPWLCHTCQVIIIDLMSIVVHVPLSHIWPHCRLENKTSELQFLQVLSYYVTHLCNHEAFCVTHRMRKWEGMSRNLSCPLAKVQQPHNTYCNPDVAETQCCILQLLNHGFHPKLGGQQMLKLFACETKNSEGA